MALITAYKHKAQTLDNIKCEAGGFNKRTKKFTPFTEIPMGMYEVLDAITAAVEAGIVDTDTWVSQLFAGVDVFEDFLAGLACYDECYRVMDRWWQALARLAGTEHIEEGFTHTSEMADLLRETADETNQI
ncbi:hypothetical protein [Noviherbaspirillum sp. UKPF54]|uniref:hypothetical protein n=1 Tax=Noviherbaspirillum sp. UKPF54 TaxID=2601898 RepID=UPI0011B18DFE|nr:hypothetical protein [Noviherbaspirillum sp. UKPF54]QDZ26559.1 hypothetical protein FAY22_00400 [Noviherbaspirillum sp. UKPF54]